MSYFESDQSVLGRIAHRQAAQAFRQQVPVDQPWVDLLNKYYDAYPEMDASVALAFSKAGIDPASKQAQEAAGANIEQKHHKGMFDRLGDVLSPVSKMVGKATAPAAHVAEAGMHLADETLSPVVRGATRTAMVAIETPLQEVQTYIRGQITATTEQFKQIKDSGDVLRFALNPLVGPKNAAAYNYLAGSSSGRESIADLISGRKVDLGSGFLPSGQVEETVKRKASQLTLNVGNVQLGGPGNPAISTGRIAAAFVSEPGTKPFNIISGLTDAGIAWYGDPAIHVGELAKEGEASARVARGISATRDSGLKAGLTELATAPTFSRLDAQTGLLPGVRNTVDATVTDGWVTKGGRRVIGGVAERVRDNDLYGLWHATKKKIPMHILVDIMGTGGDEAAIERLIRSHVGEEIRTTPEFVGFAARRANTKEGFRMAAEMPSTFLDPNNLDQSAETMERWARNMKAPPELRKSMVERVAYLGKASDREARVSVISNIMTDAAEHLANLDRPLGAAPITREHARDLTQLWNEDFDKVRFYFVDEIAENRAVKGVKIADKALADKALELQSPMLFSEYLDSVVPLPDARELRRATSDLARLVDNPFFTRTVGGVDAAQGAWKKMALLRGAYTIRVVGEEQVRMAASGLDSLFAHPISFIAALAGGDSKIMKRLGAGQINQADVLGKGFYDAAHQPDDVSLIGSLANGWAGWAENAKFDRSFTGFRKGEDGYQRSWVQSIGRAHIDPVLRRLAEEGGNREAVKAWWWDGEGAPLRKRLVEDNPELAARGGPKGSDAYIDLAHEGLGYQTNWDPGLLDAIATGTIHGESIGARQPGGRWKINPKLDEYMGSIAHAGPDVVKGQRLTYSSEKAKLWDNATGWAFSHLMTKPTNYLSRSPTFRQKYWQRVEEMIPYMDDATRAQALKNADGVVSAKQFERMAGRASTTERTITDISAVDTLAKKFGLDETQQLLYDMTQRSQFFDAMRLIFPFGEAWKEVLTRWAKIGMENPKVIRRAQQVMTGARGSGFFHKDVNGQEVFTYPFSRHLTKTLTGIPFDINGRVSGLSLMTEVLPGVGPVVQLPAAAILPDTPDWNFARQIISPYGEQDYSGGILESFLPGYAKNIAQFFHKGDPRLFANTVGATGDYLASTGDYDLTDPQGVKAWVDDSKDLAKKVYLLRGLVQFGAPTAPMPEFLVHVKKGAAAKAKLDKSPGLITPGNINLDTRPSVKNADGSISTVRSITITDDQGRAVLIPTVVGDKVVSNDEAIQHYKDTGQHLGIFDSEKNADTFSEALHNQQADEYTSGKDHSGDELAVARVVLEDFYRMQQDPKDGGVGYDNAVGEFLNRYGTGVLTMTRGKSISIPPKLPVTKESAAWVKTHGDVVHDYGLTWGLFAPQGGDDFDYVEYARQFKTGERVTITPEQRLTLAQASVGRYLYDQATTKVSAKPNKHEREWLASVKAKIAEEYPGYKEIAPGLPGGASTDQVIAELNRAVVDKRLANNQLAKVTQAYLLARTRALAYATDVGVKSLDAAAATPARAWLGQVGAALASKYPEFQQMFDTVFSHEVDG